MEIHLTRPQLLALDAKDETHLRLIDPRNSSAYVLVSEDEYESIRGILADEQRQRLIREVGLRNAAGRMSDSSA
jgi:hypothetical protein